MRRFRVRAPLSPQVASPVRDAVVNGQLGPGERVPSTRALAAELGVSRNTVLDAYGQLLSEGYLEGRIGSGTFVGTLLPPVAGASASSRPTRPRALLLSRRGRTIAAVQPSIVGNELRAFNPGFPAIDPHQFRTWLRAAARRQRRMTSALLSYGDPGGYAPLRRAIAGYVGPSRGVRCTASQVVVTAGAQRGIALCAEMLTDPGDRVWMEDPGYSGARAAFQAAGCEVVPIPVDDQGLDVDAAIERAPDARLVYTSPSHQYPIGVTMSIARRQRLLEWAGRTGAWIIEDDYDSEFRYGSRPLPTLHALDGLARVLYLGTFSKVLFPALRLAYIITPEDLAAAFERSQAVGGQTPAGIDQATLTDFILQGAFARHVRRMRIRYGRLRRVLERSVHAATGGALQISGAEVGLHVFGTLARGVDECRVSQAAQEAGVTAPPASAYAIGTSHLPGLVLGYGHLTEAEIRRSVERLAAAIDASARISTDP